ncbi:dihydroxyacetone kinase, ATP-dependent [Klebsiella pneumoniae]|uniref:Dihydroxyacetone kinase, ATP-dependent n=1 Tax=Klebsiella pneumoniae TaxID=573 RepID=A0A377XJN8_KLEPN|nr:dihydroxyacetone kinase, ATP-dependent [Klebsiella pneumoniae]
MSQFFFNQRASLVNDVIEGTIIASPWNNLARPGERPGDPGGGPSRSE